MITFADGTTLDADTVIWTAGVTARPIEITGAEPSYGPGGRLMVDEYNRVKGIDSFYAVGDICCCVSDLTLMAVLSWHSPQYSRVEIWP